MPQQNTSSFGGSAPSQAPVQFAALALRSLGQAYEMNLSASRVLLRTQARAASAVGWPDWSPLFDVVDERARQVFSGSTEQIVNVTQRANEVAAQLQREVGRLVGNQTVTVAEALAQGLHRLGEQAEQSLEQFAEVTQQQVQAAERISSQVGGTVLDTMQQNERQQEGAGPQDAPRQAGSPDRNAQASRPPGGQPAAGAQQGDGQQALHGKVPPQGPAARPQV